MTTLLIDPHAAYPPFEQLRRQLIEQIVSGHLFEGTKLPSVRRLAADLALAPNTVARAYRELEAEGYLITQGRNGTIVAPRTHDNANTSEEIGHLTANFVNELRRRGLGSQAILKAVHLALAEQR